MLAGYNDIPHISSHHVTRVAAHPGFTTSGDNGHHNARYKSGRFPYDCGSYQKLEPRIW